MNTTRERRPTVAVVGCSGGGGSVLTGTVRYRIVLRDELSDRFETMFESMEMHCSDGRTVLVGDVVDQAQLHGLLERASRLGMELISVEAEEDERRGAT